VPLLPVGATGSAQAVIEEVGGGGSAGVEEPRVAVQRPLGGDSGESPEEASCLISRLLFFWAFPVIWLGYRRGRTDLEDLPPVPTKDRPDVIAERICASFAEHASVSSLSGPSSSAARTRRPRLKRIVAGLTKHAFLQGMACHACQVSMAFLQPILLHSFLVRLSGPDPKDIWAITWSAVGIAFSVMGSWIFAEFGWTMYVRADLCAQVALSHMTFRKSLYLPPGGSRYSVGDLQNHFATDCSKPVQSFIHYSHAALLDAAVTTAMVAWQLTDLIGSAGIVAIVVMMAIAPLQFLLSRRVKRFSRQIQKCRDVRGRLCNQFLSAMRVVKCFQLEGVALEMVGSARQDELNALWGQRTTYPFNNFLASTTSLFGTIAAFSWLELVLDRPIDPAIAFTVLTWNNLLKNSMLGVPNTIASILDAYVGIDRVETLLEYGLDSDDWLSQVHDAHLTDRPQCAGVVPTDHGVDAELGAGRSDEAAREEDDFSLQACSFGWPHEQGHRGIRDLNLHVRPGELLLVCGPIGCGKSVLLEGLAGTRLALAGECHARDRSTAYVAQRPWLLNEVLLENITFGRRLEQTALEQVLDCCALHQDLQVLASGLETLVGEEGVQLSGGQKQRVSLARAVYSGADVILMDDVLSALDAHVGKKVWEQAICKAMRGRTRVMVTHQVHLCSHPAVDRILLLGPDGSTEYFGTFDQLKFAPNHASLTTRLDAMEKDHDEPQSNSAEGSSETQAAAPVVVGSCFSSYVAPGRPSGAEETRRTGAVLREDLVAYAKVCGGLCSLGGIALLIVVYYGSQLASSLQLALWANANAKAQQEQVPEARSASRAYLTTYMLLCVLTGISCFFFFLGIQFVAMRGSRNLHAIFMQGLLQTELRFFDLTPTGRALNRCLKDMATIDDRMPAAFRELFESVMSFLISVIILSGFAWEALLALPPFALVYWRIMTIYRWPARDLKRLEGISRSPAMSHFSDSIRGSSTIRAYKHEARFLKRNLELLAQTQRTVYWFWVLQGWVSTSQEVLGTFFLALIAGIVGYRACTGALSPGCAGLALSYAISMPRDLMWLSRRVANMEVEFVSIERVMEYVRLPSEEVAHASALQGCGTILSRASQLPPSDCAVFAKDVRLRYSPEGPLVLDGLSLEISSGSRSAVVGRTGCGKSSLLSALVRLYPTAGGCLQVHGHAVATTALSALRSTVRVLLQDPIFFSGTIRSNLLSRPPPLSALSDAVIALEGRREVDAAEDAVLWQALQSAGLDTRIRGLPHGLDARVEEGGQNFSQGERQLLCLARVLTDPPAAGGTEAVLCSSAALGPRILLCDEPTSACDLATDEHIHGTLLHGLPKEWTLIVVCHRLHRIREFDSVFVLESGRLAEHGSPSELLPSGRPSGRGASGSPGLLAQMCQQQGVLPALPRMELCVPDFFATEGGVEATAAAASTAASAAADGRGAESV